MAKSKRVIVSTYCSNECIFKNRLEIFFSEYIINVPTIPTKGSILKGWPYKKTGINLNGMIMPTAIVLKDTIPIIIFDLSVSTEINVQQRLIVGKIKVEWSIMNSYISLIFSSKTLLLSIIASA